MTFFKIYLTTIIIIMSNFIMADTKYKKPYYGIKLDLAQVGVDIRLNDIPIYYDDQKGQLTVDLPVPTSIINGNNELKIIAFPPYLDDENKMENFQPGSLVSATLYVQEIDDQDDKKEMLTKISIKFNEKHEVIIIKESNDQTINDIQILENNPTKAVIVRNIRLDTSFPQWQWENGLPILNNKENYSSLIQAYKDIYSAFKNKEIEKTFSLYKERAKEVAIAYHLDTEQDGHKKISTGEDMNNPTLKLHDFWEQNMYLDIYANGKMARIIDTDNDQPILFVDEDSGTLHLHKFGFYKNKEDKWVMIR